jgi:hypothetical protein
LDLQVQERQSLSKLLDLNWVDMFSYLIVMRLLMATQWQEFLLVCVKLAHGAALMSSIVSRKECFLLSPNRF